MKSLKVFLGLIIFIGAISIYIGGCSPAETTTGKLAYNQKNWEKAATELSKGLAVDKSDAEAWYMLGYAQTELGKYTDATTSFKEASSRSADYNSLIKNYWIDKYNTAINDFNSGINAYKKKDTVNSNLYFRKTINDCLAATSIIPDSISAHQLLADSYNLLGQSDKALVIYQNILDKSKSKEDAIAITKILNKIGIQERLKSVELSESISKIVGDNDSTKNLKTNIGNESLNKLISAENIFKKITEIKYLPKESDYYITALFNIGYVNYQKAAIIVTAGLKDDYKKYLNESVEYLEKVSEASKDKLLLKDTYNILIECYESLKMESKLKDVKIKLESLK